MFKNAQNKVLTMDALQNMRNELDKLGQPPRGTDVYDYAVKFFNIIANFQDNFSLADKFPKTPDDVKALSQHIANAGRHPYGWVRAPQGKRVTLNNLYLGDINGIWTNTAAKFKECTEQDVQKIIQNQVTRFIKSHREPMIAYIDTILGKNSRPNSLVLALSGYKKQSQK